MKEKTCRQCGSCCHVDLLAYVSVEDMERWERENRMDIITRLRSGDVMWAGDRIIDKYGRPSMSCRYLGWDGQSFFCEIYAARPGVCRSFAPGSSQLCPLYEGEK